jgi:hypothetical protein
MILPTGLYANQHVETSQLMSLILEKTFKRHARPRGEVRQNVDNYWNQIGKDPTMPAANKIGETQEFPRNLFDPRSIKR